ncbi:D-glycerate dehydrogenase [Candidatus Bipolaricaulota bacterium]|nr:D-glycerate dehydrogenase [Candidatus Bipolaricaulota bacterium]
MGIIVCMADLLPEQLERLAHEGHEVRLPKPAADSLIAFVADADALICMLTHSIGKREFDASPGLKVVANVAVGYENIDVSAAKTRGIIVTNTPDVLTEATADHAFALLLAAARRVPEADRCVRSHDFPSWGLQQPLMGIDVGGKNLGIVGMGRIGAAVARRGHHGFGMPIFYHSRTRKPELERELHAQFLPLGELLATSDFVSVHVPATSETQHLFDAAAFAQMKPTAILVNVARGAIVDEGALVHALRNHTIAGAGLDVFEHEPLIHPGLLELQERVVLSPHLGSATAETRTRMGEMAIDNVLAVLAGLPALTPVNSG